MQPILAVLVSAIALIFAMKIEIFQLCQTADIPTQSADQAQGFRLLVHIVVAMAKKAVFGI